METLELKHVVCYLPYNVNMIYCVEKGSIWTLDIHNLSAITEDDKLILRPLSDLKNNFESIDLYTDLCSTYNGVVINDIIDNKRDTSFISYYYIERLLQNHFDIFGLIEKKLAIDINTL